jgi:hypothetical protein
VDRFTAGLASGGVTLPSTESADGNPQELVALVAATGQGV